MRVLAWRSVRRVALGVAAVLGLWLLGCGSKLPKTYPVQGKIVMSGGGSGLRTLVGGKVRVQSTTDANQTGVGVIEDDGTFSLGTRIQDQDLPGLPEGDYKVRIEPPAYGKEDEDRPMRVSMPAKYREYEKSGLTLKVPPSGELTLTIERAGK